MLVAHSSCPVQLQPLSTSRGVSLIEVLIAVFVIAIGVLGVSSAQLLSLKNNQSSYHRSQANFLVMDMLDRMRANPEGVEEGYYDDLDTKNITASAALPACASTTSGCTVQEIAQADAKQWASNFSSNGSPGLIPGSAGIIGTTITGAVTEVSIEVTWSESAWNQDLNNDGDTDDAGFSEATGRVSMTVRL